MTEQKRRKVLKVILIVIGAAFCLSGIYIFIPASWFKAMALWYMDAKDLDPIWAEGPMFDYLLRMFLAFCVWLGIVLLVTASDVERYAPLVDVSAAMLLVLGVVCIAGGHVSGMPLWYLVGGFIECVVLAALLVVFRPRRGAVSGAGEEAARA